MAETKEYLNQMQENGNINISEEVIASIAALAALEVDGVAALTGGGVDFGELIGKKSVSKGVKVTVDEKGTVVDLFMSVKYGSVIPNVAATVQNAVVSSIESMAGIVATAVNVHVTGVAFEKEEKKTEPKEN